jgi:2-polyprenyl-6-methoxyphenol hydroxylase-like FAD-dependent oxidoreductase
VDVGVVGAGIGGLTAAIALVRAGHDVAVYERASAPNEVGAGITLWTNALAVLDGLGVGEELRAQGEQADGGVIALSTGRVLVSMSRDSLPAGAVPELLAIHRAELQHTLLRHAGEQRVRFDARLERYEPAGERVGLRFEDGGVAEHDVVVGADGLRSTVRAQLRGEEPARYSGQTCWRGIAPVPADWRGTPGEFWGPGERFGCVPIGGGRLYWFAVVSRPAGSVGPGSTDKEPLLERFGGFGFDIPRVIEGTPPDAVLHHDLYDRAPARGWSDGRVVLLGDAAHPTTPNMGQGAAMAIEDAAVLPRALAAHEDDVARAFAVFEATRAPRARFVTSTSWTIGRLAHARNPLARAARNAVFAWMPTGVRLAQLAKVAGYDATSAPLASV